MKNKTKTVKITLTDGTTRELPMDEMNSLSPQGMMELTGGKAIVNVEFEK